MDKKIYALFLMGICVLSIGIGLFIFTEKDDSERDSDSRGGNDMGDFEWFQFKDTGFSLTHLPENTHLIIETPLALYYVSADDNTQLWKYTIATGTDEQLDVDPGDASGDNKSRLENIVAIWYDRGTGIVWFADCEARAANNTYYVWELDISDDTVTEIGNDTSDYIHAIDIFVYNGNTYVVLVDWAEVGGGDGWHWARVYDVDTAPFSVKDSSLIYHLEKPPAAITLYYGVLVDDKFYWGLDITAEDVFRVIEYDITAVKIDTTFAEITTIESADNESQRSIAYDDNDILFMVVEKDSDSLDHLYQYSLTDDVWTDVGVYNIALMLDRNCKGTPNSPWQYEKAFHITEPFVYQISRMKNHLFKIQDLGLSGETIVAITDKYLITSGKSVYTYTNYLDQLKTPSIDYMIYGFPIAEFSYRTELSSDQLIEFYEKGGPGGVYYNKCFCGKVGTPKYNYETRIYDFKCMNLGFDDIKRSVSKTVSAAGIDETVIALINDNSNYLYADASSVPNIAVTVTYTWVDREMCDILYTLQIRANGYWWFEPSGYFYFRSYSNMPSSEWYYGAPHDFNRESTGTREDDIKWVYVCTIYDGELVIKPIWLDHRNVLRLQDDATAGEDPNFYHRLTTQATSGIQEYYIGTNDVTADWQVGILETGPIYISVIRINNSKLQYLDNGLAWQDIQAVSNNTFYRIKHEWRADNTHDIYVGGVLKVDNVATAQNQDGGGEFLAFSGYGDSTSYLYIDAPGNPAETDYNEGDNLRDIISHYSHNSKPLNAKKIQQQYNIWQIEGGLNPDTGVPFKKTETDPDHILHHGELIWRGRDLFPGARSQAALDAIATALKAWQGMQDKPDEITVILTRKVYYPVGRGVKYEFDDIDQFATPQVMLITAVTLNLANGLNICTLSTNIVR